MTEGLPIDLMGTEILAKPSDKALTNGYIPPLECTIKTHESLAALQDKIRRLFSCLVTRLHILSFLLSYPALFDPLYDARLTK